MLLDGRDAEERDMFLEELYDDGTSQATALEELRRHMGWEGNGAEPVQDQ